MSVTSVKSQFESTFQCPITLDIMQRPVIDPCGHTFEEAAIHVWIDRCHACPLSKNRLERDQLRPNRALAAALEIFAQLPDSGADLSVLDDERRERFIQIQNEIPQQPSVPRSEIPEGFLAKLREKMSQVYCFSG